MSIRNKQIFLSITGIIILITSSVVELPVYAMSAFLSPLPDIVGTCATVVNGDFELSGLGYVDHEDDTTTFTLSLKVNASKALLHVAFILDTWQPVEPADGDSYQGELGEYKVKWKQTNSSPNPVTVQFEPKFNSFQNGASDSFAVRVQDFVPTDTLTLEVKAGENIQTFTTSFSDFACDRTPEISLPPLDLVTDNDQDSQPDELMTEIDKIETEWKSIQEKPSKVKERKLTKAVGRFMSRMPFSQRTRQLQNQLPKHYEKWYAAADEASRQAAWTEIQQIQAEIDADPNFAVVAKVLNKRLDAAFEDKTKPDPDRRSGNEEGNNQPSTFSLSEQDADLTASASVPATAVLAYRVYVPKFANPLFAPDPECQNINRTSIGQANFNNLVRGDLLFFKGDTKNRNYAYARKFSHIGIYDGTAANGDRQVYESNAGDGSDPDGGSRLVLLTAYWDSNSGIGSGKCISLAHYRTTVITRSAVQTALTNHKRSSVDYWRTHCGTR